MMNQDKKDFINYENLREAENAKKRASTPTRMDIKVRHFLAQLARMETEMEIYEKSGGFMSGDDAVATLSWAIRQSRKLLAKE